MSAQSESSRAPKSTGTPLPQVEQTNDGRGLQRDHVAATSGDLVEGQLGILRIAFPEVFVEGKIDFDKLRMALGAFGESGPGRFNFSWAGKLDAISLLQTPSRATLVPCSEESVTFDGTTNVFIEGDNLEVLKILFKPYFGRVKLIYILLTTPARILFIRITMPIRSRPTFS
jgi:hypothetical protein